MKTLLPLDKMTREDKLQAMEELWADLSRDEHKLDSPAWHQQVLEERESGYRSGNEAPIDWETAKRKLRDITQ